MKGADVKLRMKFGRKAGHEEQMRVVRDSTAAVDAAAVEEARKGTAAKDPVIGVTPEGEVLPGAVVDGEFVEAAGRPRSLESPTEESLRSTREKDIAEGEVPADNKRMKNVWWVGKAAKGRK